SAGRPDRLRRGRSGRRLGEHGLVHESAEAEILRAAGAGLPGRGPCRPGAHRHAGLRTDATRMRLVELLLVVGVLACGCGGGTSSGIAAAERSLASSEQAVDHADQTYGLTARDMAFMHAMAVEVLERGDRAARDLE